MHEASRQFNAGPMVPQESYLFTFFDVRKDVYIHELALIALNAGKLYNLSCTLRKPFLSTSHLRSGSGKIADDVHSLPGLVHKCQKTLACIRVKVFQPQQSETNAKS